MADDPRDDTRQGIIGDWCPEYSEAGQRTLLAELDRADPLRALLADEDQAVKRLRFAIADPGSFLARGDNYAEPITSWSARAVLAALREVATSATDPCPACHRDRALPMVECHRTAADGWVCERALDQQPHTNPPRREVAGL